MKSNAKQIQRARRTRLTLVGLYAVGVAMACTTRTFGQPSNTKEEPARAAEPSRTAPPGSSENDGPVIDEKLYESAPPIAPLASPTPKK